MTTYYWHFTPCDEQGIPRLGYNDGREVRVGETLTVSGPLNICKRGLHCSERIIDALHYAELRSTLSRVIPGGETQEGDNKLCAAERTPVVMLTQAQTDELLRRFARWCALSVAHLWEMPEVVRQFLKTGDESLREQARRTAYAYAAAAYADAAALAHAAAAYAAAYAAADAADDAAAAAAYAADAAARTKQEAELRRLWCEYTGEVLE